MMRFMFCLTGVVAETMPVVLPQTSGTPAVDQLICNVPEHHHLVCTLFAFVILYL